MNWLKHTLVASAVAAAVAIGSASAIAADAAQNFYRGKTVQVLVGFGPGGGYDLYARTLARYMGKHIPGNPTVITQNMPGAGSLKVMNYLYNAARKDGTVIGTFARGMVIEPLLGHAKGTAFDATKFNWIGSISNEVSVCAFWHTSPHQELGGHEDEAAQDRRLGGGRGQRRVPDRAAQSLQPADEARDRLFRRRRRHQSRHGARRSDGRCGWSYSSMLSQSRALLDGKKINIVMQLALEKHEDLPNVPLIMDLPASPQDKAAMRLIVSRQSIARPFAAPPGVPPERIKILRDAFDATMKDPDFVKEATRLALEVRPVSGADVEPLIQEIYASPPDVVKRASEMVREGP